MKTRSLIICALAVVASSTLGQGGGNPFIGGGGNQMWGGGGNTKPWTEFKLPKTKVKLDFKNASVDMVLALFTKLSKITIVKHPNLKEPLTLTTAAAVPLEEAFEILNASLSVRSFTLEKDGNMLVIRQRNQRGGDRGSERPSFPDPSTWPQPQQTELKVYTIKYANAASVAKTINDVFQGTPDPFSQLMQQMGGRFGQGGGGGGNNRQRFNIPGGLGNRNTGGVVRASSDDYSNTVIVNAPGTMHRQINDLIDQIDKQTEQPLKPKVFKLEYAAAQDIAPVIQNVLTTNAPRGRGGAGNTNVPIEQRFQQAFRFGNAQAAFGTVVAEPRTNSVIVTATEENLTLVGAVIKELDAEVTIENSTFVVPLANARADQLAGILNQAFGTRGGQGGQNRGGQNNRGGQTNRNNQRNPFQMGQGGGNQGGGGGGRSQEDPDNLQLDVTEDGELLTSVDVGQGFPFQIGGGQQRPNQGQTTDRDAQGRLVQVRDLAGQVTVIPDPSTNSLIIVTTPGNAAVIQGILDQLDRIPEQVMIETIIVEATLDASSKLGVEWNFTQSKPFGTPGTTGATGSNFGLQAGAAAAQGFKFTLTGGSLTAFLNALQTDSKFEVLSTPRIFTSNNVEAVINISQRVPYITSQREDVNGNLTFSYSFEDVGIVLTVTPRITSQGQVTMDVNQTANDLQGFTDFNAPIINQRMADTTVSVKDGETIILGGIIRNTVTSTTKKIPLLGDIPILGNLFKSRETSKGKTELLVFLTPRIVRGPEDAAKLRDSEVGKLSPNTKKILGNSVPPAAKDGKQNPPPANKGGDKKNGGDPR